MPPRTSAAVSNIALNCGASTRPNGRVQCRHSAFSNRCSSSWFLLSSIPCGSYLLAIKPFPRFVSHPIPSLGTRRKGTRYLFNSAIRSFSVDIPFVLKEFF
jgi:hypothetical protein